MKNKKNDVNDAFVARKAVPDSAQTTNNEILATVAKKNPPRLWRGGKGVR
jgi:hypothetical protein